jgi:hypothetical protein
MALNKLNYNSLNATPTASTALSFNSGADGLEASGTGGNWTKIKSLTASSSSTLSFVDGSSSVVLDNTYREYMFMFINAHPATDNVTFEFNGSIDTGSNYNVTKTTSRFDAYHNEAGTDTSLGYQGSYDLAQSTAFQNICDALGNDNDQSCSGYLHLFEPSSTTYTKHFIIRVFRTHQSEYASDLHTAGYFNTTSAVDAIQFKMSSGNIDAGTITLYGLA